MHACLFVDACMFVVPLPLLIKEEVREDAFVVCPSVVWHGRCFVAASRCMLCVLQHCLVCYMFFF
jgi:hypothetical protein